MKTKRRLISENEYLKKRLEEQRQEIVKLSEKLYSPKNCVDLDMQAKYMCLITKYNKLLDSCLSNETENITYNGELYGIQTIDFHKDVESVDTIDIRAVHIPREKGLINNLSEPFKNVAKELNHLFFGNENM